MSPRKKHQKKSIHPQKAPKNNFFSTIGNTPEGRAKQLEWIKKGGEAGGRPKGVPDGHTLETITPIRNEAKRYAKKVVEIMSDKFNIEEKYEKEALTTAVQIMREQGATRERLAAARLVLDFTKSKPASKSDVSISRAEDFLTSLLEESDGPETKTSKETTTH